MQAILNGMGWGRINLVVMITLGLVLAPYSVFSKEVDLRAVQVVPDQEKRSCIQEVDGYAYLSEEMTLSQVRKAAFLNAKRQAVEMAKTYIESNSVVEDFVLKSDTITGSAAGAVTILEQKDLGVEKNTRYHVWIKAEVEYSLGSDAKPLDKGAVVNPGAPLTVRVWTPKKQYKDGEIIEVYLQGNRDFYARIVDITSDGQIVQLLPNAFRKLNYFKGGKVYKIPDVGDQFDLKVSPPYGQDQIVVYASEVPLGDVEMEPLGQGLSLIKGNRAALESKTRGISVVGSGQKTSTSAQFYEAGWILTTGE